jgi:hypothetical protein
MITGIHNLSSDPPIQSISNPPISSYPSLLNENDDALTDTNAPLNVTTSVDMTPAAHRLNFMNNDNVAPIISNLTTTAPSSSITVTAVGIGDQSIQIYWGNQSEMTCTVCKKTFANSWNLQR